MIIDGKIVPLSKLIDPSGPDTLQPRLDELATHKLINHGKCFDPDIQTGTDFILGYNSLNEISNFRNIIDCITDAWIAITLLSYPFFKKNDSNSILTFALPFLFYRTVLLLEAFSLKRGGHIEFVDLCAHFTNAVLSVDPNELVGHLPLLRVLPRLDRLVSVLQALSGFPLLCHH